MYITDKFVFMHMPKTAGTTVMRHLLPSMSRNAYGMELKRIHNTYHKHIQFLPEEYSELPRMGFVRNPWAWYTSWLSWTMAVGGDAAVLHVFARDLHPSQPNFFTDIVKRILSIGDGTDASKTYAKKWEQGYKALSPMQKQKNFMTPYCYATHVNDFKAGYFTWWYRSMYYGVFNPQPADSIEIGQMEHFTDDFLRITAQHVDLTPEYITYVRSGQAARVREDKFPYQDHYDLELASLIAERDGSIINKFGYQFNQEEKLA